MKSLVCKMKSFSTRLDSVANKLYFSFVFWDFLHSDCEEGGQPIFVLLTKHSNFLSPKNKIANPTGATTSKSHSRYFRLLIHFGYGIAFYGL